jgi:hypothetical protein
MSFRAFRRTAATLLVAMLAVLACAEPSHAAAVRRHRSFDDAPAPGPAASLGSFISFLFQLFEQAGGGLDPNGFK